MTTNPLVDFLASYGPKASGNNMYDEFVDAAAKRTGCKPIKIRQLLAAELAEELASDSPRSVILTGTAGDGKTYTARKVLKKLSGGKKKWRTTDKVLDYKCGGRKIRFIKDLSELNDSYKDDMFSEVCSSLAGNSSDIFIICANDGHLLKFFRDRRKQPYGDNLHREITKMLRHGSDESPDYNFRLINMSHRDNSNLVDAIIDSIVDHTDWNKCEGCPILTNIENPCPIRSNANLLRENENPFFRARLRDIIRMASSNGKHLPIRQLILLVVNIVLGDSKGGARGSDLMNCRRARIRAKGSEYEFTNPYANVFGENIRKRQRDRYSVFSVLGEFGVGYETNNYFDQELIGEIGQLPDDPIYGNRIFKSHRNRYRSTSEERTDVFFNAMINQRRRLFFSTEINEDIIRIDHRCNPWNLTIYQHGASHCKLVADRKTISDREVNAIQREIILGLNRIMSGYMTRTSDRLWIIEPSGVYQGHENPLVIEQAGQRKRDNVTYSFESPVDESAPPRVQIRIRGITDPIDLNLRPSLTECLIRVAHGALPASFSSECLREIERFQLRVVAALQSSTGDELVSYQLGMKDGKLEMQEISVLAAQEQQR